MKFLEVFSPDRTALWPLGDHVEIHLVDTPSEGTGHATGVYRCSPIHPLDERNSSPPIDVGRWRVHLLVPYDAFALLGKISQGFFADIQSVTWFGVGIASVLIFDSEMNKYRSFFSEVREELLAHEVWHIDDARLVDVELPILPHAVRKTVSPPFSTLIGDVPPDIRGIIEEFRSSFREAKHAAKILGTQEYIFLDSLLEELSAQISNLVWLSSERDTAPPEELEEYDLSNPLMRSRLIQQASDRVVQINSSLSYVVSQAYHGTPPILSQPSLIRRHSLLGVGRAHRALVNLVREIEDAFREPSLAASIYDNWSTYPPLPGFDDGLECNSTSWKDNPLPDNILHHETVVTKPYKLAYFSGRLGFRETEYSVSSAIQSLTSGDSPEWHLSTMTHEMLHGEVRDIIHVLFDRVRDDDPPASQFWPKIFSRFRDHMLLTRRDKGSESLLDSARHILLSYCCLVPAFGSLTKLPLPPLERPKGTEVGVLVVPDEDEAIRKLLDFEERNISEIIVHVLDLFYFFFDNVELYMRTIWASWRNVPVVLEDPRQYVIRSLLIYTSLDDGDIINRFSRARNAVRRCLLQLAEDLGDEPIIQNAAEFLVGPEDSGSERWRVAETAHNLFQPFFASVRIVDFAVHCLGSGKIRGQLFHEDVFSRFREEMEIDFGFESCEFIDRRIQSVAELTAWRARSKEVIYDGLNAERRAAWLLIACGGLSDGTGGTSVDT